MGGREMLLVVLSVLYVIVVTADTTYSLGADSNFPYRRIAIPFQHDALQQACAVLKEYSNDMMIIDCMDEQLYATDDLVIAGLLMANSSDPTKQAEGYALLDQVYNFVYGIVEPMLPLNDVWGYDDDITGRSYALVGASNGVHIVDVTVAISPVHVFYLPGAFSLWRDIKIYNRTLYAVNDDNFGRILSRFPNVNQSYIDPWKQEDGLVIIDLSYALQPHFAVKTNEFFDAAHNIQTEHDFASNNTSAVCSWCRPYVYVVGGDVNEVGGFIVLDVTQPQSPKKVGSWNTTYIHDLVVHPRDGKYIAYAAAIYAGVGKAPGIFIIDVTDPTNPTTLYSYYAHWDWTHNCWPTDDGQYLYVTHEDIGSPITIWSIADLANVYQVGELFIANKNIDFVAHNVHVRGNNLWVSYYSQGSVVYDITDRVHPKLIGHYDTAPDIPYGMDGTWGIYPYANSQKAYATDMSNGLYVLELKSTPTPQVIEDVVSSDNFIIFVVISSVIQVLIIIVVVVFVIRNKRRGGYDEVNMK